MFVYGFEKKDRANIDERELEALKDLAKVVLGCTQDEIERQIAAGSMIAVLEREKCDG